MKPIFLAPLFLAACMHTPCPVPCVTPEDCVCLVTGTIDAPRGDGGHGYTPDTTGPDAPGGKSSDENGGHSNGGSSNSNGDSSDE